MEDVGFDLVHSKIIMAQPSRGFESKRFDWIALSAAFIMGAFFENLCWR